MRVQVADLGPTWQGVQDGAGPNYKGLGWIRTSVLLLKLQIGLGVLSIPCEPSADLPNKDPSPLGSGG